MSRILEHMTEHYKSKRNVFYTCHSHVVWCLKYGSKVLVSIIKQSIERQKHV